MVNTTGTFIGDSVCERESLRLMDQTVSLWSFVNRPDIIHTFMNPVYEPNSKVIWPSVAPASLVRFYDSENANKNDLFSN